MMINCPKHGNTRAIYLTDKTSDEAVISKCYMCDCDERHAIAKARHLSDLSKDEQLDFIIKLHDGLKHSDDFYYIDHLKYNLEIIRNC